MPIGYLLPAALLAFCTGCAALPRRVRIASGPVRFRFGFMINELPLLAGYLLAALTVSTLLQGGIATPVGWAALTLTLLAVAGLAVIVRRQTCAGSAMDRALGEGLGAGWRGTLDPGSAARLRAGFAAGPVLFLPRSSRRRDVERIAGISYGDGAAANTLDVYRSRAAPPGRPVLIHLHGGQLRGGKKNREGLPLIYGLASRGWLCISANYRLMPAAQFPAQLVDVKKVIAWVRAHGVEHGADPRVVFVAGSSSGAQLAALAALTANDPAYQPGFETTDTSVSAAVAMYGIYGPASAPALDPASDQLPIRHVRADAPPFFLAHGDLDTLLRVEGAREFVERLRQVSRSPVVYAELPGAQHNFDMFRSVRADNTVNAVESFAAWVRQRH